MTVQSHDLQNLFHLWKQLIDGGNFLKSYWMLGLAILLMMAFSTISVNALEIRGSVATDSYTWSPQNFAGFGYDIDQDVGTETLTTFLTEGNKLSGDAPYGIVYEANNRVKALSNAQADMEYGKLRVSTIDPTTGMITLDNKDNAITLSKNKNTEVMPEIYIRVANNDTLRYYIYENITKPGTYEIRGAVATAADNSYTWNPQNFAGFYYDINKDLGTEMLTTTLTDGNRLSGDAPYGVTYATVAQAKECEFEDWGSYIVIGFQGKEYFAGYNYILSYSDYGISPLFRSSIDENSLSSEQLEKILINEEMKMTIKKGESIKFKEGYELFFNGINSDGQIYLELLKNGKLVDESFLAPSRDGATISDKTYCYRTNVGSQKGLVVVAVHFRSTYKDEERALAVVDGIWQISDTPIDVRADTQYGKMTIRTVDATNGVITMDNKDNAIVLAKKSDIELMPGIQIRTANNDTLRYYIYKTETVGKNSA
jgi:S-layer protein (TIGR01567 family)